MDRATRDKFASGTDQRNLTAGNATWETPPAIYDDLAEMYQFDIDICADAGRAFEPVWFGPGSEFGEDALTAPWHEFGTFGFCNPPYGAFIAKVLPKAVIEAQAGFSSLHLLPLRMTKAIRQAIFRTGYVTDWLFPDKRITFFEGGEPRRDTKGNPCSAMFDSTILIFRPGGAQNPVVEEYIVPPHVPVEFKRKKVA